MVLEQYLHISYCFREANQKKGVLSVWTLPVFPQYCLMKMAFSVHFAGVIGLAMALWHYAK